MDLIFEITFLSIYFVFRGLIFGLSEEQSKSAISSACRSILLKAGKNILYSLKSIDQKSAI